MVAPPSSPSPLCGLELGLLFDSETRGDGANSPDREGLETRRTIGLGSAPSLMTAKDAMAAARRNGHVSTDAISTPDSSPAKPAGRSSETRPRRIVPRKESVRFQSNMTLKDAQVLAEERGLCSSTEVTTVLPITDQGASIGGIPTPSQATKPKQGMLARNSLAPHYGLEGVALPKQGGFGPGLTPSRFSLPGSRKYVFVDNS